MTVNLRDKGLRTTFAGMLNDNRITRAEVHKLIESAEDGPGLSQAERKDFERILGRVGDKFDPDAKAVLQKYLDTSDAAAALGLEVGILSRLAGGVSDVAKLPETFLKELAERSAELTKPEDAFRLFAEYGGRLKALAANLEPGVVDAAADKLLDAGRSSSARGYDKKDTDHDTRSDLWEAARGRDPNKFDARDEEVGKVWTSTYWPMAGSGDNDQDGSATSHLWSRKGPLAKLDDLLKARGMDGQAKAVEFERKPALGWLIGDRDTGHFIPQSRLREDDAERTTGLDFDGDGKITAGVKVDFLNHQGSFAAVANRNQLVPRATLDGNVVDVKRERVTGDDGSVTFKFSRTDTGAALTDAELKTMFYANPSSGSGKADGTMDVGWWGSCDKTALGAVLFKEPLKDSVTVDGVTFSKLDMLGLLTVIADSQAIGNDFVGNRYDGKPDILVLNDGRQLQGKLQNIDDNTLRGGEGMWRWDGDFMVLSDPFKDDPGREVKFRELNGTEHTVKASEIKHMAREDKKDIAPMEFHTTILDWLAEGKPAAMDRDSGDHVWNYPFHGATLKSATELSGSARPSDPGHNGHAGDNTKVVEFKMDVRFGDSTWPREYRYWLEFDDTGKAVNGAWKSENPDFLWRPAGVRDFTGPNPRNPFVKPEFVKELYDMFMKAD
jgi:hypothetical protein